MKLIIQANTREEAFELSRKQGVIAVSVRQGADGWIIYGEPAPVVDAEQAAQDARRAAQDARMAAQENEFQM